MIKNLEIWRGDPYPLGATFTDEGVNFALYAENAIAVELCLFDSLEPIATAREPAFARSGEAYGSAAAYDLRDRSIVLLQLKAGSTRALQRTRRGASRNHGKKSASDAKNR